MTLRALAHCSSTILLFFSFSSSECIQLDTMPSHGIMDHDDDDDDERGREFSPSHAAVAVTANLAFSSLLYSSFLLFSSLLILLQLYYTTFSRVESSRVEIRKRGENN